MKDLKIYKDESGADKGDIHLMVNNLCYHGCKLCCNRQYDLASVPVITVEELRNAHTVTLTGGEPFLLPGLDGLLSGLRHDYKNVKNLYVYTSGAEMFYQRSRWNRWGAAGLINGYNISPKNETDFKALEMMFRDSENIYELFTGVKHNRFIFTEGGLFNHHYYETFLERLRPYCFAETWLSFDVEYRQWQEDFKPNGGVWRRLPIFFF